MPKVSLRVMRSIMCQGVLLVALVLSGCNEEELRIINIMPNLSNERVVATVYRIKAPSLEEPVPCYRLPSENSTRLTRLRDGQLVDLVAVEDGMIQNGDEFWLHVYPRLTHRTSCYINTRHLIPVR